MRWLRALTLAAAFLASGAVAQVRPQPGIGDPHIQTLDYQADQVTLIEAAPGYQIAIELAPDEQIANIALGDSAAWQASANRAGNRLFVKLAQSGSATNMTVITNVRQYSFELSPLSGPSPGMAYSVRFRYPKAIPTLSSAPGGIEGRYRLSGARNLWPKAISDDGMRTYILWADDVALPAIYALETGGKEVLLNGNMRDGAYVIDSVPGELLFRIDASAARASRRTVTKKP